MKKNTKKARRRTPYRVTLAEDVSAFFDELYKGDEILSTPTEIVNDILRKAMEPQLREGGLHFLLCLRNDRMAECKGARP